ncbi:MAG: hypothetical protein LR015_03820 [Verrucomicrobia bacterium]|nr:hypothetical protein [Verrucomicrobiota bacterium]
MTRSSSQQLAGFDAYLGIDYSGAGQVHARLPGLRVYQATPTSPPQEVLPFDGRSKYWSRAALASWLTHRLSGHDRIIVGIDHAFSFPLRYFDAHGVPHSWDSFLTDFCQHWPLHLPDLTVDDLRAVPTARAGDARWRRRCDVIAKAKSVFHFDVPGSVAKSTHTGLPWLLQMRRDLLAKIQFWPFDGWELASAQSVLFEAYPSLYRRLVPQLPGFTNDQWDAYCIALWLRTQDLHGQLAQTFSPPGDPQSRVIARIEGWIPGV